MENIISSARQIITELVEGEFLIEQLCFYSRHKIAVVPHRNLSLPNVFPKRRHPSLLLSKQNQNLFNQSPPFLVLLQSLTLVPAQFQKGVLQLWRNSMQVNQNR